MCGKESNLLVSEIEGTQLNVCQICSKHGKVIRRVQVIEKIPKRQKKLRAQNNEPEEEIIDKIVEDFGRIIKDKREKLSLKQDELASKINEKTSLINNIERQKHEPSIKLARKIEKFLGIKLIGQEKIEKVKFSKSDFLNLTIGDILRKK
jgi:putative transcription factor